MNRLKTTNNGGFPFDLDDLRWAEQSVRDAFLGLMSAFGITQPQSFIISGCVVTGTSPTQAVSAGWICLEGEICQVDAIASLGALPGGHSWYWKIDTSYDSTGLETFENSSSNDTYEIRKATVGHAILTAGTFMPLVADTLQQKISKMVDATGEDAWHGVGDSGEPAFNSSWVNVGGASTPLRFKKDKFGRVHLSGAIKNGTFGNTSVIFVLPVGYRPLTYTERIVSAYNNANGGVAMISIAFFANGNVLAKTQGGTSTIHIGDGTNYVDFGHVIIDTD